MLHPSCGSGCSEDQLQVSCVVWFLSNLPDLNPCPLPLPLALSHPTLFNLPNFLPTFFCFSRTICYSDFCVFLDLFSFLFWNNYRVTQSFEVVKSSTKSPCVPAFPNGYILNIVQYQNQEVETSLVVQWPRLPMQGVQGAWVPSLVKGLDLCHNKDPV